MERHYLLQVHNITEDTTEDILFSYSFEKVEEKFLSIKEVMLEYCRIKIDRNLYCLFENRKTFEEIELQIIVC